MLSCVVVGSALSAPILSVEASAPRPPLTIVLPLYVFRPLNNSVPPPVAVMPPAPEITPPYVSVVPVATLIVPLLAVVVMPRLLLSANVAVVASVPPLSTMGFVVAPRLLSAATERVPALPAAPFIVVVKSAFTVLVAVYVFAPASVSVPPLTVTPVAAVMMPLMVVVPAPDLLLTTGPEPA